MIWPLSICMLSFIVLFLMSVFLLNMGFYFIMNDLVYFIEWEILSLNSNSIVMTLLFDWMSLIFMGFVLFISSLVIFYSDEYMEGDLTINRFIILVLMFVLSMMFLIISPNLISILLGWDGLGLVSYCLVIYYQNVKSYNAGMLTALSNRIGDVALLMSIAWMLNFGGWNYIYYLDVMKNSFEMKLIGIFILLAAMTKSAQIPFSSWLPAAMAAPTPVSALVHSSTLVTAGVYLLIRFNEVLVGNMLGQLLLIVASLTMFMAGMGANFEYDLKKIIALSTLSQLGLMMSILAMGFPKLAYFHLLTHALFKALLFMCAGAVIHNMKNSQDIRNMGSLVIQMPLTSICFNVSNLLSAIPYLGTDLVQWVWGGFAVDNATLTRFFTFHFILPFIVAAFTLIHLLFLHQTGSNNPLGLNSDTDKIPFHPYFTFKDIVGFMIMIMLLTLLTLMNPYLLGDPDNFIPANPLVTPVHIQPEWYFLFAYAILRSIPNKLGGVIALVLSIAILFILPFFNMNKFRGSQFYPMNQLLFWSMTSIVILLTWIGARPVEDPYIITGQILTILYFMYYLINPLIIKSWDKLIN